MRIEITDERVALAALTGAPPPRFNVWAKAGDTDHIIGAHESLSVANRQLADVRTDVAAKPATVCSPIATRDNGEGYFIARQYVATQEDEGLRVDVLVMFFEVRPVEAPDLHALAESCLLIPVGEVGCG